MTSRPLHPARRPRRPGFTLVELIIVVLILAICATLAVPLIGSTTTTQLVWAAQLLEADLAFAQVESIAHPDDPRVVVFDTLTHSYHIAALSNTATPITNTATQSPYLVTFGKGRAAQLSGVTFQSLSVGGDDILGFGIYGQLDQATAATLTLAIDGHTLTLTLDPTTGRVTVGQIQ